MFALNNQQVIIHLLCTITIIIYHTKHYLNIIESIQLIIRKKQFIYNFELMWWNKKEWNNLDIQKSSERCLLFMSGWTIYNAVILLFRYLLQHIYNIYIYKYIKYMNFLPYIYYIQDIIGDVRYIWYANRAYIYSTKKNYLTFWFRYYIKCIIVKYLLDKQLLYPNNYYLSPVYIRSRINAIQVEHNHAHIDN